MEAEMAANLEREWDKGRDRLSPSLQAQLARGREVTALDYHGADGSSRAALRPCGRQAHGLLDELT
jgi:hypothetical protein